MKALYCKDGFVIASHDASVSVPDNSYPDTDVVYVPDDYTPVYEPGAPPMPGMPDMRRELMPVVSLSAEKDRLQTSLKTSLDALSNALTQYNPTAEVLSWPAKETAARQYLKDGNMDNLTDTQKILLNSELTVSGSTDMQGLCESIIAKALLFAQVAGGIAGLRTSMQTAILNAKDSVTLLNAKDDLKEKIEEFDEQIQKALGGTPAPTPPPPTTVTTSTSD